MGRGAVSVICSLPWHLAALTVAREVQFASAEHDVTFGDGTGVELDREHDLPGPEVGRQLVAPGDDVAAQPQLADLEDELVRGDRHHVNVCNRETVQSVFVFPSRFRPPVGAYLRCRRS